MMSGRMTAEKSLIRAVLVRHGQVDRQRGRYDTLSAEGLHLRDRLPELMREAGISPRAKFHDASDGDRCRETLGRIDCPGEGFAPGKRLRNINAVLDSLKEAGDHVICYRWEAIEAGALYHVDGLVVHPSFGPDNYPAKVKEAKALTYDNLIVLERDVAGRWRQSQVIRIPQ